MESKVTSFRLPLETLKQLEFLVEAYNRMNEAQAEELGIKVGKITKGDIIAELIKAQYDVMK